MGWHCKWEVPSKVSDENLKFYEKQLDIYYLMKMRLWLSRIRSITYRIFLVEFTFFFPESIQQITVGIVLFN